MCIKQAGNIFLNYFEKNAAILLRNDDQLVPPVSISGLNRLHFYGKLFKESKKENTKANK